MKNYFSNIIFYLACFLTIEVNAEDNSKVIADIFQKNQTFSYLDMDYYSIGAAPTFLCVKHFKEYYKEYKHFPSSIPDKLLKFIPETGPICEYSANCGRKSVVSGYLDPEIQKYSTHFHQFLVYCSTNQECNCYWPEYSNKADYIHEMAFLLFRDLIFTTVLSDIVVFDDPYDSDEEICGTEFSDFFPVRLYDEEFMATAIIKHLFKFSDYYRVCVDIENYSKLKFNIEDCAKIKNKLEDILEALIPQFFELYSDCLIKHPNQEIEQEVLFIKLVTNQLYVFNDNSIFKKMYAKSDYIISDLLTANLPANIRGQKKQLSSIEQNKNNKYPFHSIKTTCSDPLPFSAQSEIFLQQGTLLNNLLLYHEAIECLNQSIKLNSSNRNAYIERAAAYFELDQLSLALQDYNLAKKLTHISLFSEKKTKALEACRSNEIMYTPNNFLDFSKGISFGVLEGSKVAAIEFIPSIYQSLRGLSSGLWAFACSPQEVSSELLSTAYQLGVYISSNDVQKCLEFVIPEINDLSLTWKTCNDYERGTKIGFIIGKYGIDIFISSGFKAISKVQALKRANSMLTLEVCASSKVKQALIAEESAKIACAREKLVKNATKKRKILIRNPNVQYHIMQKKHDWEKIIKITGNLETDFKKVVKLLEENKVFLEKYREKIIEYNKNFLRYDHKKRINGFEVQVIFNKNLETGEMFLNDAWVITK